MISNELINSESVDTNLPKRKIYTIQSTDYDKKCAITELPKYRQ